MLRGRGDGREVRYLAFTRFFKLKFPECSVAELEVAYSAFSRSAEIRPTEGAWMLMRAHFPVLRLAAAAWLSRWLRRANRV
jgi:hypothetical protein